MKFEFYLNENVLPILFRIDVIIIGVMWIWRVGKIDGTRDGLRKRHSFLSDSKKTRYSVNTRTNWKGVNFTYVYP